jgi:hypothetical protein
VVVLSALRVKEQRKKGKELQSHAWWEASCVFLGTWLLVSGWSSGLSC